MITIDQSYACITIRTASMPPSADGKHPAGYCLIGIGLFLADRDGKGRWNFKRQAATVPAGGSEGFLLEWAADRLPANALVIGWKIDQVVIPVLLNAAETAPPAIAHHFLARLHRLPRVGAVDLSLQHGGASAPSFTAMAAEMAIRSPDWNADVVLAKWAIGDVHQIRHDLADEALALWRVFVRMAGVAGIDAEAQTDEWVRQRKRMRVVTRTGRSS